MPTRRRRGRTVAGVALGIAVVLLVVAGVSQHWAARYCGDGWIAAVSSGAVYVEWRRDDPVSMRGWACYQPLGGFRWIPSVTTGTGWPVALIRVPLWPLVLLLATPSAIMWRRSFRRRPGFCKCGYDLAGNTTGVCPECGTAATS